MPQSLALQRGISKAQLATGAGGVVTVALVGIFLFGQSTFNFWVLSAFGLVSWSIWAFKQPVYAFAALLLVWFTVYSRTTVPIFQVEGSGNRGGIALGDLLWACFLMVVLIHTITKGIPRLQNRSLLKPIFFLICYPVLAMILPLAGVVIGGWPISFAMPGIRQVEWGSFAVFGYWLASQYGSGSLIRATIASLLIGTALHMTYSALQVLFSLKLIPQTYLALDSIFSDRFSSTWFFYPRATGLLVNPNSYGVFGAFVFMTFVAILLSGHSHKRATKGLLMFGSLWAALLSGSRSAVLGIVTALAIMFIAIVMTARTDHGRRLYERTLRFGVMFIFAFITLLNLALMMLPEVLKDRFLLILAVLSKGVQADRNAIGRLNMWIEAGKEYWINYPLGTWVPPSYALHSAIDNYYVVALTQGSPIFLLTWLLFLLGAGMLSTSLVQSESVKSKCVGLTLVGFTGVLLGSSFTLSLILQPQINSMYWSAIGLAVAMANRTKLT